MSCGWLVQLRKGSLAAQIPNSSFIGETDPIQQSRHPDTAQLLCSRHRNPAIIRIIDRESCTNDVIDSIIELNLLFEFIWNLTIYDSTMWTRLDAMLDLRDHASSPTTSPKTTANLLYFKRTSPQKPGEKHLPNETGAAPRIRLLQVALRGGGVGARELFHGKIKFSTKSPWSGSPCQAGGLACILICLEGMWTWSEEHLWSTDGRALSTWKESTALETNFPKSNNSSEWRVYGCMQSFGRRDDVRRRTRCVTIQSSLS
jgi:hypothetical protein